MVTYQCESCGGELELSPDNLSGKCRYCRSVFFFRAEKSEALTMALNRAGEMRRKCDFDGALTEYQVLLQQSPEDAEAHWGMVLSTYGIEYVEDPRTRVLTPTCRRTVMESILENAHYKQALACASAEQKPIYEKKAAIIDRLQKKIKRQLEEEEDYDVFISFKSTDENGYPTKDRLIARNLYDALTAKGIRTFYSEVTLADRIGEDYEPIIYKALYSSKCFILVATKEEYINAVWVKNEWARYRDRIMDEGLRGAAFAVFEGISPAALPPFLRTQGIDLAKYPAGGYAEQIADNLAKKWGIAPKEDSAEAKRLREELEEQQRRVEEQLNRQKELEQRLNSMAAPQGGGVSVANIISRANLFLEEKNWNEAEKQSERALDVDARCAEAYLVKLLCELQLTGKEKLRDYAKPFDGSVNYKRAVQFAGGELREYLTACARDARKEEMYLAAQKLFDSAKDETGYKEAAAEFAKIPGYKDADQKKAAAEIAALDVVYRRAEALLVSTKNEAGYKKAAELFATIPGYKDADEKKAEAATAAKNTAQESVYQAAMQAFESAKDEAGYKKAAELFATIPGYKDADEKKNDANRKKTKAKAEADETAYNDAVFLLKAGDYERALKKFKQVSGYKDADELCEEASRQIDRIKQKELRKQANRLKTQKVFAVLTWVLFLIATAVNVIMSISRGGAHGVPIVLNLAGAFFTLGTWSHGDDNYNRKSFPKVIVVIFCVATISLSVFITSHYTADNGINCYKYTETEGGIEIKKANMYLVHVTDGKIEIPSQIDGKKVVSIRAEAFRGKKKIVSVTVPDSVTSIGEKAFQNCEGLTSATIPNSVTSIGYMTFLGCNSLTSITIPDSVTSIGSEAFCYCTALTSITIPKSVTEIGTEAFSSCKSLTTLVIADGAELRTVGKDAFADCGNLTNITAPASAIDALDIPYSGIGETLKSVRITSGVITQDAFVRCVALTSVTIDEGVTEIGGGAFFDCSSLTSITIPDSVTSIGKSAFEVCSSLTSVTIGNGVTSIGDCAFYKCSSLTSVAIGNSVTSIGSDAFRECNNLTSITIPDSVTSIGVFAFGGCRSLTSITFNGTTAQWKAISKRNNWNDKTGAYTVYCTDGTIKK